MTAQHAAAAAAVACVLCMHVRAVHATCSITATIYHQLNAADMSQPQQQRHYINRRHPRHAALQRYPYQPNARQKRRQLSRRIISLAMRDMFRRHIADIARVHPTWTRRHMLTVDLDVTSDT